MKTSRNFNLVEIIIAMGIIVVCLTTVIGLFSAGMQISKDSSMKSYANVVIEQIVGYYDTNASIKDNIPDLAANTTNFSDGVYWTPTAGTATTLMKPVKGGSSPDWTTIKAAEENYNLTPLSGEDSTINVYQCNTDGLFRIEFQSLLTQGSSTKIKDFTLIARMWIEDNTGTTIPMSDGSSIQFDRVLKVEISWPPQEPYMNRLYQGNVIYFEKDL